MTRRISALFGVFVAAGLLCTEVTVRAQPQCDTTPTQCLTQNCFWGFSEITQVTNRPEDIGCWNSPTHIVIEGQCGNVWEWTWFDGCPIITGTGGGPRLSDNCTK
jgi:hypothetical protein